MTIHPDPAAVMDGLLAAELDDALPPMLPFWRHTSTVSRPGPWVFSQWHPTGFTVDGVDYHHAEGYMMAEKARLFGDDAARERIVDERNPAIVQRLGRTVHGFDDATWRRHRYDVVVTGNLAKFGQDEALTVYIASTAPRVLVEASPIDRIWGVGRAADDLGALRPSAWRGENLLGFALMRVRDLLAA